MNPPFATRRRACGLALRTLLGGGIVLALVAKIGFGVGFGFGGAGAAGAAVSADSAARPRAGAKAPPFVLNTVDKGEPRSLELLIRGAGETRGLVLIFLSSRCPYVAQARQPLADLVKRYGGKVAFVGVNANQNETLDDVKADAAWNFSFPVLRDDGAKVAERYAADRTPEAFLIDDKAVIRYHGGIAELAAALADFTAGRAVAKPETKAFGCTIKRKG